MKLDPINWSVISSSAAEKRVAGRRTNDGAAPAGKASEFIDAQVALAAPKRLLSALRDLMAAEGAPKDKLDTIVGLVARELRADVCACYILRAGEVLELFSAAGLPLDPNKQVRVQVGEGPIGDIAASARPAIQAGSDATPHYHAIDDISCGVYRAMAGVPVLRGGRVYGVLSIQNRLQRAYGDEVIDILQTVAMLVAELVVAGGLMSRQEMNAGYASGKKPTHVEGVSLGAGQAIGRAVMYEPGLSLQNIVSGDTQLQKTRLRQALSTMQASIDRLLQKTAVLQQGESRDILEAYQMFARDRGWMTRIETAIDKGLSAEAAVSTVLNDTRARMGQMQDVYIRERLQDLEDLSNRLLSHLLMNAPQQDKELPDAIVLFARSLGPAALLDYDPKRLKGVVLEKGSHTNHVAIVARALGIPVVGQCKEALDVVQSGDEVIVDGDHGHVYIRPSQYVTELYARSMEERAARSRLFRRQPAQQAQTLDGKPVSIMMNAGLMNEVENMAAAGADGIGLFRTELAFMTWQKYPRVVTQAELYGRILDVAGDKPVIFRTLDIGGDKPLPYFKAPEEENPALGWRAVRIGMDRPAVLRTQFRAFIRGAKGRNIKILLPFVTEVAEFTRARSFLEMEKERARASGIVVPEKVELGAMIEVPAVLWQLENLLKAVDFISVGTNDLMQYLFAVDRSSNMLRDRYDPLSPAFLRVLKSIADAAQAAGKPVSVCGEMAGKPLEAMVLVALGFDTLSASLQSIDDVRRMVPTLDTSRLKPYLERLMQSGEHSLRERLMSFARDHSIVIQQEK